MEEEDEMKTLISYQRQELISAKNSESDLDYAFNLQLQEAIAASQLNSPQKEPISSPSSFSAIAEECSISDLILAEIDKYEQERTDFEQCRSEMSVLKQNLNIQLHDHNFASEIARIPDHDWVNHGDYVEKPYFNGSSSSSRSNECFRVYFKGILDYNGGKKLGAIGVAICDPRDNLIFEVSKAVADVEEGEMSVERVEFEALVAGLDVALVLELKNIEFCCDNFMFYQIAIGRNQPTDYSIINVVDRLNRLQRRFRKCTPSLIARCDVKFAFRLARSSMSSQLLKSANSVSGNNAKESCSICFEERVTKLMFSIDGCNHRYCVFCIEQHLEAKLLDGTSLPKCPSEGCKSEIAFESCRKLLSPKLLDIMSQRLKEATIPPIEKVYCPNPNCSMLMSKTEVKEYSMLFAALGLQEPGSSRCNKCHELFCVGCKVRWHEDMSCEYYQRHVQSKLETSETMLKSLAWKKRWSQCRQCKNMIELAEGCYHITCRCGAEFCYICGAAWKDKKQTCKCRLWDERNLIHNQVRRN